MGLFKLRLPRLRYDRVGWVLFLVVIGLILLSSVGRKKNSFAEETEVEIEPLPGNVKLITERDVKTALVKHFGNTMQDVQIRDLEIESIENMLEKDPFVFDANAFVDQHNNIRVRIQQREPLLRILDNNGGNYYLDKNGAKMPTSKNFAARVLVATGNIPPYSDDFLEKRKNPLKDVFTVVNKIQDDSFLKDFIQQIHVSSTGDIILVPLIGDQKIILGSANRLDSKLSRLKIFYQKAMPYVGWNKYKTINLKYNGQVVCKK